MSAMYVKPTDVKHAFTCQALGVLHNQSGSTMLPVLGIFLAVSLVFQSTELTRIAESHSMNANARIRDSRNSLQFQLNRYSSMPVSLRNSLVFADNAELQNCLLGNGGSPCQGGSKEYPLKLYGPSVAGVSGLALTGRGAADGVSAQPVFYNTRGKLCEVAGTQATPECPFEVTSTFKATCPGMAPSCATAESIAVQFSIRTPEELYNVIAKDRLVLASKDTVATELAVKDILPPSYDYIPNAITKVTFVTNTTETTQPATTTNVLTYQAAYDAILRVIGGTNTTLAKTIADSLYTYYKLRTLSTIEGLAEVWLKSPSIARRIADGIQYRVATQPTYVSPTAAQVAQIASVPLTMPSQMLGVALSSGVILDTAKAQAVGNAILGMTSYQAAQVTVSAGITDSAIANAINTTIVTTGLTDNASYVLAEYAKAAKVTDASILITYANVLIASGATHQVAWNIMSQGITDIEVAKQMVAASTKTVSPTTTTATTTTTPTTTTTTVTTTVTQTTSASLTAACTSSIDCGTTIGM